MDAVENAINRLMRKLKDNGGDLEALEIICTALRESTNSSHNNASPKLPPFEEIWKRVQVYPEWSTHLSSINRSMDCECFYDLICRQLSGE